MACYRCTAAKIPPAAITYPNESEDRPRSRPGLIFILCNNPERSRRADFRLLQDRLHFKKEYSLGALVLYRKCNGKHYQFPYKLNVFHHD
jgi:hypothetical protein